MRKITRLKEKLDALPKSLSSAKVILPLLEKYGIGSATFYRDLKAQSIPSDRLQVYAGILGCDVDDLLNSYSKITPLTKSKLAKKVGLILLMLIVPFFCRAQRSMVDTAIVWIPFNNQKF